MTFFRSKLLPILALAILAMGLFGCTKNRYVNLSGFTQGTTFSITYAHDQMKDFSAEIEDLFNAVDYSMSLYRDSSIISLFNASEDCYPVDLLLAEVVTLSLQISDETQGAFDITIGPLVREWGFHMKRGETPSPQRVQELLTHVGSHLIYLSDSLLCKTVPEVTVDLNAIAPGYTADLLAHFFEEQGVYNYLVEVGGEIRTRGVNPGGKDWRVGVDKPVDNAIPGESLQVIVSISGKALVTSGNYRKFYVKDGVRYSHTINPLSGYPVNHSLLSATVVDSTAARADALATAFMVMGVETAQDWLAQHPEVDALLIFSTEDGEYEMWMSEGFKAMVTSK